MKIFHYILAIILFVGLIFYGALAINVVATLHEDALAIISLVATIFILGLVAIEYMTNNFIRITLRKTKIRVETFFIKLNNPYKYIKEVPFDYGVGVVSILFDLNIEYEKDVVAGLLDLCAKRYAKLQNSSGDYRFFTRKDADISKLLPNEKYLYDCIDRSHSINYREWRKLCYQDAQSLGLVKNRKYAVVAIVVAVLALVTALLTPFFLLVVIAATALSTYEFKIVAKRTALGREHTKKWLEFYKFLKESNNFARDDLEQIKLWMSYLSHAQVFGLAKYLKRFGYQDLLSSAQKLVRTTDNFPEIKVKHSG